MATVLIAAGFALGLILPSLTQVAEVTVTTTLNAYLGSGAYLEFYLTDANGTSFLIVTHDTRLAKRCVRIIELIDGNIASDQPICPSGPTERQFSCVVPPVAE